MFIYGGSILYARVLIWLPNLLYNIIKNINIHFFKFFDYVVLLFIYIRVRG